MNQYYNSEITSFCSFTMKYVKTEKTASCGPPRMQQAWNEDDLFKAEETA